MSVPSVTRPPLTSEKCTSKTTDATRFKNKMFTFFFLLTSNDLHESSCFCLFFSSENNELMYHAQCHFTHISNYVFNNILWWNFNHSWNKMPNFFVLSNYNFIASIFMHTKNTNN